MRRHHPGLRTLLTSALATVLVSTTMLPTPAAAVTITAGSGDLPITQVVLNDNGSTVTQNASQVGVIDSTANPVDFVSITVDDGGPVVLDEFNVVGADAQDFNFPPTLTGVRTSENGVATAVNTAGFEDAVDRVLNTLDIRDYLAYDALNESGTTWNPDFDFMFTAPMRNDDYLLVMERNGNTFFDLIALDAAGDPIVGGEVVGFDAAYRWNTGYAPSDNTGQPMWFTVVDIEAFNVDTHDTPIYGFRIDNDGEADVKFFGLDDEPFLPDLEFEKTVYAGHDSGASCGSADGELASITSGGDVTFCFEITNNGEAPFIDLAMTDSDLGLSSAPIGSFTIVSGAQPIAGGSSLVLAYETTAASSYVNTATVSVDVELRAGGTNPTLSPMTESDTAEVQVTGPAPSSIGGTVVDDLGNPIPGVTITLSGTSSDTTTTGPDGTYTFTGLTPGTYTVTETQPSAYADGGETAGTAGGNDTVDDVISGITLTSGTTATGYDFDELRLASIAGTVVDDLGDPIQGVTITLSGSDTGSTSTGADGTYDFSGLAPGTYTVTETQPTGYGDGGETAGTAGGNDTADDVISAITLGAGVDATGYDFDETTGSIAGTVVDDLGNPIQGVTITLSGDAADSATTGADGTYTFDGLLAGTYTVTETQPTGYADGADSVGTAGGANTVDDVISGISLGAGVDATGYDFAEQRPAAISGTVVDDLGNPIQGVTITLSGDAADSATTGADGTYTFAGLTPGTYTVTETQPTGYADGGETAGTAGGDDTVDDVISGIVLSANEMATGYDFDETTGSIAGTVVDDEGNPIPSVTITLSGTSGDTTTTGPDGTYRFDGLLAGTYTVTETQPTTFADGGETAGSQGGDDTVDDVISGITLPAGVDATGYDFDELRRASIGGTVVDDDGTPIQGVTITLSGADDDSTTTGADGTYLFTDLDPGTYTVTETQPTGYGDGGETAGSTGGDDTVDDVISAISLPAGVDATGYDFDETTGSIAGTVVDDLGNPIPGVTIALTGTDITGPVTASTQTTADGTYAFDGLLAGTYTIAETQPTSYLDGGETAGTAGGDAAEDDEITGVTLTGGQDAAGYDFDELRPATITGSVIDDEGEPIPGVVITLTGTDDLGPVSTTVTTTVDGSYTFDDLRPGTYDIAETQPDGYGDGGEASSDPGAIVSNDLIEGIVIGAGGLVPGNDFTETTSSIAGAVVDEAGNPIAGVTITLTGTDVNGNQVSLTTTTGSDGTYSFVGLVEGTYALTETQPDGFTDGGETAGSTGGTVANDQITSITLGAGVASVDNDFDERRVVAQGEGGDAPGTLAFTGSSTLLLVLGSAILLALGLGLILVDRRRPTPARVPDRRG